MSLENQQNNLNNEVEFAFERPVGWSSACLDSTINYYLHCNDQDLYLESEINIENNKS